MANVLLIGAGPLPEPDSTRTNALALRTWQVARPLLESPHNFKLLALPGEALPETSHFQKERTVEYDGFFYTIPAASDVTGMGQAVRKHIDKFHPHCIITVGQYAACIAAQSSGDVPLWCDLPGNSMMLAQVRSGLAGDDSAIERAWSREKAVLLRADKFSVASMPQLYALLGELSLVGRMNYLTSAYHFAHHIPDAMHPAFTRAQPGQSDPIVRGVMVPKDAFLVLWSGSFSPSMDVETLSAGLEEAMKIHSNVYFVSTGGTQFDDPEVPHHQFVTTIKAGPFASRHHFMGWMPFSKLAQLYRECDLGLCIDGMNYETLLGARARVANMMACGLPVAITLGTELSHIVQEEGVGFATPANDAAALAEVIVKLAESPQQLRSLKQKARAYAIHHLVATTVCRPIREWVDHPEAAPDNQKYSSGEPMNSIMGTMMDDAMHRARTRKPAMRGRFFRDMKQRLTRKGRRSE